MTNAKLNEICCVFAGIPPTNSSVGESGYRHTNYPLVSSDWGQAGRLMEVLEKKDIRAYPFWYQEVQKWVGRVDRRDCVGTVSLPATYADSGPRALCLAVAELAKEAGS